MLDMLFCSSFLQVEGVEGELDAWSEGRRRENGEVQRSREPFS
jgi:hypothetical protein